MMCNEQAYSLAVEKLLNIQPPPRAQWIRGTPAPARQALLPSSGWVPWIRPPSIVGTAQPPLPSWRR